MFIFPPSPPPSPRLSTQLPYTILGGTGTGGQVPSQEQLEAIYKQLPSSTDQLELMQKQVLALMEQQQKMASMGLSVTQAGGGVTTAVPTGNADRIQVPLLWLGVPGLATTTTPFSFPATTSSSKTATPSPTSSTTSNDSGLSGMSQMSNLSGISIQPQSSLSAVREPLSLGGAQQRRPLSESQSAPGFQTVPDSQFEALQKQFQIQQQQLLLQSQQINQHYLEQQQRSGCTYRSVAKVRV